MITNIECIQVNHIEGIKPELMILLDVLLHSSIRTILLENQLSKIANETLLNPVIIVLLRIISHLGECINNDTEDNIQQDCDDEQEESQIVSRPEIKAL